MLIIYLSQSKNNINNKKSNTIYTKNNKVKEKSKGTNNMYNENE